MNGLLGEVQDLRVLHNRPAEGEMRTGSRSAQQIRLAGHMGVSGGGQLYLSCPLVLNEEARFGLWKSQTMNRLASTIKP